MVGDREESFGERSRNQVCGYFPKDPTGSPLLEDEWVRITCGGNTPLSGGYVTVQKALDHQRLFSCGSDRLYYDRLRFSELAIHYKEDGEHQGMPVR